MDGRDETSARERGLPRAFWRLWSCTVASNGGDGVTMIALAWAATTVTRDATLIAVVAAAQRLPWLVLVLPFGAVVDRSDRLAVMARASALRAAAVAVLAVLFVTGNGSVAALVAVAIAFGAGEVLFDTAAETAVPDLVPRAGLARANGHLRAGEIVAGDFLGRPLGGLLLRAGVWLPFVVTCVASVAVATVLARAGGAGPARRNGRCQPDAPFHRQVAAGLALVWRTPALRLLAMAAVGVNTLFAALLATQVLFVQSVLGLDSLGFGLLLAVASLGAVAGSQSAAPVVGRLGPAATLAGALAVTGACFAGVAAVAPSVAGVAAFYTIAAAAVATFSVAALTVRQSVAPRGLLGRVNAVLRLATWGTSAVGLLLGGLVVDGLRQVVAETDALTLPYAGTAAVYLLLAAALAVPLRRALGRR